MSLIQKIFCPLYRDSLIQKIPYIEILLYSENGGQLDTRNQGKRSSTVLINKILAHDLKLYKETFFKVEVTGYLLICLTFHPHDRDKKHFDRNLVLVHGLKLYNEAIDDDLS
jgi:hypothetical protein